MLAEEEELQRLRKIEAQEEERRIKVSSYTVVAYSIRRKLI
jgi:hypothetical protein